MIEFIKLFEDDDGRYEPVRAYNVSSADLEGYLDSSFLYFIPLTKKISRALDSYTPDFRSVHVTGCNNVKTILNGALKRNRMLSTSVRFRTTEVDGIIDRGVMFLLRGECILHADFDFFSKPSKNGLRWVPISHLTRSRFNDSSLYHRIRNVIDQELDSRERKITVSEYVKMVEDIICGNSEHRGVASELILSMKSEIGSNRWSYDEAILDNYTVERVYAYTQVAEYQSPMGMGEREAKKHDQMIEKAVRNFVYPSRHKKPYFKTITSFHEFIQIKKELQQIVAHQLLKREE